MKLGPDDLTPNPDGPPTADDFARRLRHVEHELRELKREFSTHKSVDFDELEDRVDKHDLLHEDHRKALVSIQTTNGLILQGIDRKLESMVELLKELRRSAATEVTTVTVTP